MRSITKPSYGIIYGFLGGPAHGRSLRKKLGKLGLVEAPVIEDADILIAHSAGCWRIPKNTKAKLILLIGMPLQTDQSAKTFRRANILNSKHSIKNHHILTGFKNALKSGFYGLKQPGRNIKIIKNIRGNLNLPKPAEIKTVFIMNRYDPWTESPELEMIAAQQPYAFICLPGTHGNIWEEPAEYVNIINQYVPRILA